jgi:AcrR family transcriptional regulator
MDRRQRKSREAIFSAFSELLAEKSFGSITVQEIIDRADVGRTTFYAHFPTKDALLEAMCDDIFDHVFGEQDHGEATHDFSGMPADLRSHLTHLLCHLRDRRSDMTGLIAGESGDLFMGYFCDCLRDELSCVDELFPSGVPRKYAEAFYVSSFAELVRLWVREGMERDPATVVDYYLAMAEPREAVVNEGSRHGQKGKGFPCSTNAR